MSTQREPGSALRPVPHKCLQCRKAEPLDFQFLFAYQPIVALGEQTIYAHEALVRGPNGESAGSVLAQVNDSNRYVFDQACRVGAIKSAAELGMQGHLSINFMPNAVFRPENCIQSTFDAAELYGFPSEQVIFEVAEGEQIANRPHLVDIFRQYRRFGFQTAIDDFGAGYAGLNLLAEYQPHIVKLDMGLVRDIDSDATRRAIVRGIVAICRDLNIKVLAEGIETGAERNCLQDAGIDLMQGYLFSRPALQAIGIIDPDAWP